MWYLFNPFYRCEQCPGSASTQQCQRQSCAQPTTPPAFQVGCPSVWSLTGTREREGSSEGIPGITPRQVNPKNNPSKTFPSFSPDYICSLERTIEGFSYPPLPIYTIKAIKPFTIIGAIHYFFPKHAKLMNDHLQLCTHLDKENFSEKGREKPGWVQTNPNA